MRDAVNIRSVDNLGIDWMGFIFWPGSSRYVSKPLTYLPVRAKRVGVFVDEKPLNLLTCAARYRLDFIQLHGHESPAYIRNVRRALDTGIRRGIRMIKAISVSGRDDIAAYKDYEDCVDYLLFDTKCPTVGGSGQQFDWLVLDAYDGRLPFLLSGGIGPDDARRVRQFRPPRCIGIDLTPRFESAPAIKDINLLNRFLNEQD